MSPGQVQLLFAGRRQALSSGLQFTAVSICEMGMSHEEDRTEEAAPSNTEEISDEVLTSYDSLAAMLQLVAASKSDGDMETITEDLVVCCAVRVLSTDVY